MATLTPIDFLILDEHTAALDPKTADVIMELTDRVVREKKLTAHDGHAQPAVCAWNTAAGCVMMRQGP